jgi:hypothetical protein
MLTISQDHLKRHAKEDDISYETLDAVKKLKPDIKNSTPEAKAAERWSLTYRFCTNFLLRIRYHLHVSFLI